MYYLGKNILELVQNGKIICIEALSSNPLFQLYRDLTPKLRTDWEKKHILGPKQLKLAKKYFNVSDVKYWFFFTLMSVPFRKTFLFKPIFFILKLIDDIILKIPFIQRIAWQFTFVLNKKNSN